MFDEEIEELIPLTAQWSPVQAYYAVYLGLRALVVASGQTTPNDHTVTLRCASKDLRTGRIAAPAPWSALCVSCSDVTPKGFLNLPGGVQFVDISTAMSVVTEENAWSFYATALRTTRVELRSERFKEWKRKHPLSGGKLRKNMTAAGRQEIDDRLYATSVFDLLYRLRLRSNYSDADSMVAGHPNDAANFSRSLGTIVDRSLLILEAHIRAYIGRAKFDELASEFLAGLPKGLSIRPFGKRQVCFLQYDGPG